MRLILLSLLCGTILHANVTPVRCGKIWVEDSTYHKRIGTILSVTNLPVSADSIWIDFGDATSQTICMADYISATPTNNGYLLYFRSSYHLYSDGTYNVILLAGKREANVLNIPNSAQVDFVLNAMIVIDPNIFSNWSPYTQAGELENDFTSGMTNLVWINLNDIENDSIYVSDVAPIVPGHVMPQVAGGGTWNLDNLDFEFTWNPQMSGLFTARFLISEYRYINSQWMLIGQVTHDMLIDADNTLGELSMVQANVQWNMFPNPANEILQVSSIEYSTCEIVDLNGRTVFSQQLLCGVNYIDVSMITEGVYVVRVGTKEEKLVIAR